MGAIHAPPLCCCTTHSLVRERDVDELIQPPRTQNGWVNDVRPVGGSNDEHVLLLAHPVHLREDLVDDTIGGTA